MAKAPKPTTRSSIESRLAKIQVKWTEAVEARSDAEQKLLPPYDKVNSKLKRVVYRLVRDCLKCDLLSVLKDSVQKQPGDKSQVKPSSKNADNPFYWGFTAVCGIDKKLARSNKSRFSQELLYAHMHDVPPEFLIGFIYQIGSSSKLQQKIDNKEMQRWFKAKKC